MIKITNSKQRAATIAQIAWFGSLEFRIWNLFGIWCLKFGAWLLMLGYWYLSIIINKNI